MRNRNWKGLLSALFVFAMFSIPTFVDVQKARASGEKSVLLGILCLVALGVGLFVVMLVRIYRDKFVLEFSATEIIDRRFLRITRIPYADIEFFSPTLDRIFRPDARFREIQNELEIGDYLMVTCRLKEASKAAGPAIKGREYFFSETVAVPDFSDFRLERAMRAGLEGRGIEFENLYEIDEEDIEIGDENEGAFVDNDEK
jgi:hypothetical protein